MASKEGRACACAFAFGALRSYRVFVGQNADNVFFSLMVSLRKKKCVVSHSHCLKFTSCSESFHFFWLVRLCLLGFSGQAPVLDLFEAFIAFPSSQEFGRMEDISCNVK